MKDSYFTDETIKFLRQLDKNNTRDWFEKNKSRYEAVVRTPALRFIEDMQAELPMISPHFLAIPRKVGGSLMRVYRDVRFSKDKSPYKTNIGIQFRHEQGKDVHAPGFYVHISPQECFIGVGIWRPDSAALAKIRDAIVERDKSWLAATNDKQFNNQFDLRGDSLKRPPRGYDKEHPLMDDLKRKDFIAISEVDELEVVSKKFGKMVLRKFADADPYMQFLCKALELHY